MAKATSTGFGTALSRKDKDIRAQRFLLQTGGSGEATVRCVAGHLVIAVAEQAGATGRLDADGIGAQHRAAYGHAREAATDFAQDQIKNMNSRKNQLRMIRSLVDSAADILLDPKTPLRELGELMHQCRLR